MSTWMKSLRTFAGDLIPSSSLTVIDRWLVTAVIAITLFCSNIYRLFPVAEATPLIGDKIYYYCMSLAWIGIVQALRTKANYSHDKILLSGFFSLCLNELADEIFFNPYEVTWGEIVFNSLVTISVCANLKMKWYYRLLIVASVIGLGLI